MKSGRVGKCCLCGRFEKLVYDHKHRGDYKSFRGWLCYSCNVKVGFFETGRNVKDLVLLDKIRLYVDRKPNGVDFYGPFS